MMDRLDIFRKTAAQAHRAGRQDSRHFITLYKAYLRGASETADEYAYNEQEQNHSFKMALAAMTFALLSWAVTLYFVFR
jgi:hypothetical protein